MGIRSRLRACAREGVLVRVQSGAWQYAVRAERAVLFGSPLAIPYVYLSLWASKRCDIILRQFYQAKNLVLNSVLRCKCE